jgi:hypothetical protein
MDFWDFNETDNYVDVSYKNINYRVLNKRNKKLAAQRLYEIETFINLMAELVRNNMYLTHGILTDMCQVFLSIHPHYYRVQEMQIGTMFDGMNKPKEVKLNKYLPKVGADGKLKASYRVIFFQLRHPDDKIKKFNELFRLVMHEIAHTGCNHVRWRDDDHGDDFKLFETYLYYLWSKYRSL